MSLRIISGTYKGKVLFAGNKNNGIRPTGNLLRGSIFDIVRGNLTGARFLDLFAGSGAVGFEALSQGASKVFLVEKNPEPFKLLQKNSLQFAQDKIHLHKMAVTEFCKMCILQKQTFDIIFADPPFDVDFSSFYQEFSPLLASEGILLVQTPTRTPPHWIGKADKTKKYGESTLAILYN